MREFLTLGGIALAAFLGALVVNAALPDLGLETKATALMILLIVAVVPSGARIRTLERKTADLQKHVNRLQEALDYWKNR